MHDIFETFVDSYDFVSSVSFVVYFIGFYVCHKPSSVQIDQMKEREREKIETKQQTDEDDSGVIRFPVSFLRNHYEWAFMHHCESFFSSQTSALQPLLLFCRV